jgi:oligopeptide/dipeptide ABC transporter ATP-binding protein
MNSLDPLQTISHQAWKIAKTHSDMSKNEALDRFEEMFEIVGLQTSRINDYAHQFSGGMEQRAIIALALFLNPSLVIADEPTTALDVIMQDQIFKYLDDINEEIGTSMLLITHDISVVLETCEKMAVMHSGQVAERGLSTNLYDQPRHPYAIMLQEAFPDIRYPHRKLGVIDGHPPQTIDEKDYCTFVDRCPWAVEDCSQGAPQLEPIEETDGEHFAACIRKDEIHELYEANNASEGAVENEQITSTGGDVDD